MEKEKLNVGDSYIYTLIGDEKKQYGFVVISIYNQVNRQSIEFAIVNFDDRKINNLEMFQKGQLYTRVILNPQKNILGIFCYEFQEDTLEMLKQFKYVGNTKIDKSKFMVGSGTTARPEPRFSKYLLNGSEVIFRDFNKTPLQAIIAD